MLPKKESFPSKPFSGITSLNPISCHCKQISDWLKGNTLLPLPNVIIDITASFLSSTTVLYVSHRSYPWESHISEDSFCTSNNYVPTIPQKQENVHHWCEKCFEVYLDATFFPIIFPNIPYSSLLIQNQIYYVLQKSPNVEEEKKIETTSVPVSSISSNLTNRTSNLDPYPYYRTLMFVKNWMGRSVYWIMNDIIAEGGDDVNELIVKKGNMYYGWTIELIFYVRCLLPQWTCAHCSYQNQITQHCCQFCWMVRFIEFS